MGEQPQWLQQRWQQGCSWLMCIGTDLLPLLLLLLHVIQVYIIHRRNEFRASKVMQKRALEHEKIKVRGGGWVRAACRCVRGALEPFTLLARLHSSSSSASPAK